MLAIAHSQQSVFDQPVRAREEPIPGERRQGLIRRIAVAYWSHRQRLPPALPCLVEAVDPVQRRCAHIADAVGRRQRRDVQQDAGGPIVGREWG